MAVPSRITDQNELPLNIHSEGPAVFAYTAVFDYDGNGNLIYQGWAQSSNPVTGAAPNLAAAVWAIRKLTYDGSNRLTQTQWANGNTNQTNIWNNRASLSYQ